MKEYGILSRSEFKNSGRYLKHKKFKQIKEKDILFPLLVSIIGLISSFLLLLFELISNQKRKKKQKRNAKILFYKVIDV